MTIAVVAQGYGGPEQLALVEVDDVEPGPGQVRVEVRAAGVNPFDAKRYSGAFGRDPGALPMRLGAEVAGVVTAVGPDAVGPVGPVSVGDEVIGYRVDGAYASALTVPASSLVPKPAGVSFAEAAGVMLAGATAVHALTVVSAAEGDTVLVHAASGGVGLLLVQLARLRGARVIGTAGQGRHELLRSLGAEPVVYGPGLADRVRELAPEGVDAAIDAAGTDEAVDTSLELVADRSRITTIAAFARAGAAGIKALGAGPGADPGTEVRDAARPELARLLGTGELQVLVAAELPLAEVARAHELILEGHTTGKIVLVP
ncbi:MAG: NADP-dependent oxidoreductase [Kineosporiaceae bacterium]